MLRVTMLVWEESEDEQAELGRFILRSGKIVVEPTVPDAMPELRYILNRPNRVDAEGNRVGSSEDPEAWLRALPMNYDGAHVRALLEEES